MSFFKNILGHFSTPAVKSDGNSKAPRAFDERPRQSNTAPTTFTQVSSTSPRLRLLAEQAAAAEFRASVSAAEPRRTPQTAHANTSTGTSTLSDASSPVQRPRRVQQLSQNSRDSWTSTDSGTPSTASDWKARAVAQKQEEMTEDQRREMVERMISTLRERERREQQTRGDGPGGESEREERKRVGQNGKRKCPCGQCAGSTVVMHERYL